MKICVNWKVLWKYMFQCLNTKNYYLNTPTKHPTNIILWDHHWKHFFFFFFFDETKMLAKYHKVYIKQDNTYLWPSEYKLILLRTKATSHGYIIIQILTTFTDNIFLLWNYMYQMLLPTCAVRTCMSSRLSKGTTGLYFIHDCGTTRLYLFVIVI